MNRHAPQSPAPSRSSRAQRGSVILYLIVSLVAFGVLALAGASRFGATVGSVLSPNCATSSRLMAESGVRYAMARLRAQTSVAAVNTAVTAMNGTTFTVDAAKGLSFTLAVTYDSSTATAAVTSTGRSCGLFTPVTNAQAQQVYLPIIAALSEGVSFDKDIAKFIPTKGFSNKDVITVDTTAKTVGLGNFVGTNAGAVWYTGTNSFCDNGNCTMGTGLCAYWEFQFNPASQGDGFVWTLMSGDTNISTSAGGDVNMGELMGYGGIGTSGQGIRPPKLGLEFDAYNNSGTGSICSSGSRSDSTSADHVAFMFWGATSTSPCNSTYDDNRHGAGAGTATEPLNSWSMDGAGDGWDGYYYRPGGDNIWMERGDKYLVRYELDRPATPNAEGNYVYLERAWVKKSSDTYSANMSNCSATNPDATTLARSFALSPTLHTQLTKAFFGFAEGTGAATQFVTLSNFVLQKKGTPATPTTPTVPSDYVAAYTFYEAQGGTAHDLSSNHNDIAGAGTAMWAPDVRSVSGASLFVAGGGGAVSASANPPNLDLTTTGSVSAWIKIRNYVDYAGIVHKGRDINNEAYSLQFTTSGKLAFQMQNVWGGQVNLQSTANAMVANGNWYHVAATWDAGTVRLYINGSLNSSTANTIGAVRSSPWWQGNLIIGAQQTYNPIYGFDGYIDDVYLYNRALSAAEVAGLAMGHP